MYQLEHIRALQQHLTDFIDIWMEFEHTFEELQKVLVVHHEIELHVPILLDSVDDIVEATCELQYVPAGKKVRENLKLLFFWIKSVVECWSETVARHVDCIIRQIVLKISSVFVHVLQDLALTVVRSVIPIVLVNKLYWQLVHRQLQELIELGIDDWLLSLQNLLRMMRSCHIIHSIQTWLPFGVHVVHFVGNSLQEILEISWKILQDTWVQSEFVDLIGKRIKVQADLANEHRRAYKIWPNDSRGIQYDEMKK